MRLNAAGRLFAVGLATELALLLVSMVLGYFALGAAVPYPILLNPAAITLGLAAALLPSLVIYFLWLDRGRRLPRLWASFCDIVERLRPALASPLQDLRAWQIVSLSLAAGIGEEALFRGVVQPLIGLVAASLLFGVVHAVNLLYLILAAAIGFYLGWLFQVTGNLLPVVVAHAAYDVFAFLLLRAIYRP